MMMVKGDGDGIGKRQAYSGFQVPILLMAAVTSWLQYKEETLMSTLCSTV